ncbi:MAG TPA: D-alanyl-D-alanine carboxypeptidase [Firmicutes bacterium]|nr:D-alanyl-D-alanine carboxypeptidase [Bacillota bacterium]
MKSLKSALVLIFVLIFSQIAAAAPFEIDASKAVLLDFDSGQILFSQNGEKEHVPASLVKVMTMYVAFDLIKEGRAALDDTTTVTEDAWRMIGSRMFLEPGEIVTLEELLYGIAVVSGNDACVALAQALAGSENLYVKWMNEKAQSLGLNLSFTDVHGLADTNRITAEDMALLVRSYLKEHPEALAYHREPFFAYQPRSAKSPIKQGNRNGLLKTFEGADGLKTGHLQAAGYNLVGTAVQNNRRLVSVILGAESERRREEETAKLLSYGFRSFDLLNISRFLENKEITVYKGRQRKVALTVAEPYVTLPAGTNEGVSASIQAKDVEAPVKKGQEVGIFKILLQDKVIKETPLLAGEDVARGGFLRVAWDSLVLFFKELIKKHR